MSNDTRVDIYLFVLRIFGSIEQKSRQGFLIAKPAFA